MNSPWDPLLGQVQKKQQTPQLGQPGYNPATTSYLAPSNSAPTTAPAGGLPQAISANQQLASTPYTGVSSKQQVVNPSGDPTNPPPTPATPTPPPNGPGQGVLGPPTGPNPSLPTNVTGNSPAINSLIDTLNLYANMGQGPQAAIDALNKQGTDSLGAEYYAGNNTIGVQGGYLTLGANGQWGFVPRTPNNTNPPTTTALPPAPPLSPQDTALQQQLVSELMNTASQPIYTDPKTDPYIQNALQPYAAAETQAARASESQLAEQAGPNANNTMQDALINQQSAQQTGAYGGSLVQADITQRIQQVQYALTNMAGILTQDEQNTLQSELANLNAALALSGQNVTIQEALLANPAKTGA